jgi:hypothetical protein
MLLLPFLFMLLLLLTGSAPRVRAPALASAPPALPAPLSYGTSECNCEIPPDLLLPALHDNARLLLGTRLAAH